MPLVIEDGTGDEPTANSYATVAELKAYADARDISLAGYYDTQLEVFMIRAMDFIESRKNFQGERSGTTQPLMWPRRGVYIDNIAVDPGEIPRELVYGQIALAIEAMTNDLMPNQLPSDSNNVIKEKIGDIEIAYSDKRTPNKVPAFAKANALLSVLYKNNGLMAVRV